MMLISKLKAFFNSDTAGGVLLILAAVLAMIAENSALVSYYDALLNIEVAISVETFSIAKPLLLWINDGLMALFFFVIGLEIKREFISGELSDSSRIVLPAVAAVGGMAMPAIIYSLINAGDPVAIQGWAIPSATDIAFALGVLSLLGNRVPPSLKIFLVTLAILDDLGAIVIIALFYTADLSVLSLTVAMGAIFVLFILNRRGVISMAPYLFVGLVLWAAVLKSGVHATLAGVVIAFFIPGQKLPGAQKTQLETLEHDLAPLVTFGILPLFAFANAGVSFQNVSLISLLDPVPLGIALGLFLGDQLGVFGFSWLAIKLGFSKLPTGVSWMQLYGVSAICGIGFTMSLFIGSLAFTQGGPEYITDVRLGILVGSIASGLMGYVILRYFCRNQA